MPRWNRALWAALASFVGALLLLLLAAGLHRGESAERTDDPAPLPPPGLSTTLLFAPASNWRRYQLELTTSVAQTHTVDLPKFQAPPCDLEITIRRGDTIERRALVRLHQNGAAEWGPVALFGSDVFEFSPGDREVVVANKGCEKGYTFVGGVLQMRRVSPVMFSRATLPLLAASVLSLLGLVAMLAGLIGLRRNNRAAV